jgi:hypothetical protein
MDQGGEARHEAFQMLSLGVHLFRGGSRFLGVGDKRVFGWKAGGITRR